MSSSIAFGVGLDCLDEAAPPVGVEDSGAEEVVELPDAGEDGPPETGVRAEGATDGDMKAPRGDPTGE